VRDHSAIFRSLEICNYNRIAKLIVPSEKELTLPQIIKCHSAFSWKPSVSTEFLPVTLEENTTEIYVQVIRGS
jgi:hypothetical protein